tara:strand:- start:589 stop:894 length:306 start_codon:yes stop_codon:yes gene_type:complete
MRFFVPPITTTVHRASGYSTGALEGPASCFTAGHVVRRVDKFKAHATGHAVHPVATSSFHNGFRLARFRLGECGGESGRLPTVAVLNPLLLDGDAIREAKW